MKVEVICDFCGKVFLRESCYLKGKKHHFCSRQCLADFSSREKNPDGYMKLKNYEKFHSEFRWFVWKPERMDEENDEPQ